MTPTPRGRRAAGVACDLVARARAAAPAGEIPALRRAPGRLGGGPVGPGLLKAADEQSVVGLAAVLRAAEEGGLDPAGFAGWGVVAAPGFLGRAAFGAAFPLFLAEGAWGVSPLLISSHSLHAVSGVVSQALGAHGPNLGVGGTPGDEEQALLVAASWLADGSAAGVWVVLTGWTPGDGDGAPAAYEAVALALTAAGPGPSRGAPRLVVAPGEVRLEPADRRADGGAARGGVPAPHLFTKRPAGRAPAAGVEGDRE